MADRDFTQRELSEFDDWDSFDDFFPEFLDLEEDEY